MTNKKFFPAAVLSLLILFTACSAGSTEVSETVSETISEAVTTTAAETTSTISETNTEATTVTTTAAAKIIDTSGVEYIKEALQAEWDKSEYDISVVKIYASDLNGDDVKELFVTYMFSAGQMGITYVYDVSDGMKKLYEISARMWSEKRELYKDENGTVHLIFKEGYAGGIGELDIAYFNIAYDSIEIPIYAKEYDWYDGGAHLLAYDLYKNCEFAPLDFINGFSGWRNFDPEKAEYIGRFDTGCVWDAIEYDKSNDISEIIQKEVYADMTYVSDIEMIYDSLEHFKNYSIIWDFEKFWQKAAPKLAEVYSGIASAKIIDTSGVEYMKEALKTDWDNSAAAKDVTGSSGMTAADLYAVDLNGDGVKELFVNYSFGAGADGFLCVYDVSGGVKKLYEISARIWADKAELYTDTDGNVHFILANGFSTWISTYDYAFFDITYNSIKMPFYADDHQYHNDVGHVYEYNIYKNCEVVPNVEKRKGWRNFDPEKAEYIGRFDTDCVLDALDNGESNEISEIIQKEVYEGLTYVSDIEMICENSGHIENYRIVWDFEEFWQGVAPKLAELYCE